MTTDNDFSDSKTVRPLHQPADRVLSTLKTRGRLGIPDLAKVLDVTVEAVRQQMAKLQDLSKQKASLPVAVGRHSSGG